MTTAYFSRHDICRTHDMGSYHPEAPDRLPAIEQGLELLELDTRLDHRQAPLASMEAIRQVHDHDYIDELCRQTPDTGTACIDNDTWLTPQALTAAGHAAGAGMAAVDAVMGGEADNAFCAVRPPGHHAEHDKAMGFCFFNNVAIAAHHAMAAHGLSRVAIVDFDVHHGNGIEDIFRHEPRVLYCSSYQNPFFPFTEDRSIPGHLIKSPLRAGTGGAVFRRAIERDCLPALHAQQPELIILATGFDAHRADPMADLMLEVDDFSWITRQMTEVADEYCHGRIVSILEGGYALDALAACAASHVQILLDQGVN